MSNCYCHPGSAGGSPYSLDNSEPEDCNGPDAFIGAPISPRPHLNSGTIAMPEPEEIDLDGPQTGR